MKFICGITAFAILSAFSFAFSRNETAITQSYHTDFGVFQLKYLGDFSMSLNYTMGYFVDASQKKDEAGMNKWAQILMTSYGFSFSQILQLSKVE